MSGRKPKKALGRGLSSLLGESVPLSALRTPAAPAGEEDVSARDEVSSRLPASPAGTPTAGVSGRDAASAGESGIRLLGIDELQPGALQPRQHFDEQEIAELARSIERKGVLQPLLVRPRPNRKGFEIVAGERRWRAAQKAQLHQVPVLVRDFSAQEALEIALVENVQRTDLNPMEESHAYQQLVQQFGYSQDGLAEAVGKSRPYITNALRLQKLDPQVQAHVRAGRLSAGAARALIGRAQAARLAREIVRRGLNVRQVEALAASQAQGNKRARPALPPDLQALERRLSEGWGLQVQLKPAGAARGRLIATYDSLEQLEELVRRVAPRQTQR